MNYYRETFKVYERIGNGNLIYRGQAHEGSAEKALATVAVQKNLSPGKYAIISLDLTFITTGNVKHAVVMDR